MCINLDQIMLPVAQPLQEINEEIIKTRSSLFPIESALWGKEFWLERARVNDFDDTRSEWLSVLQQIDVKLSSIQPASVVDYVTLVNIRRFISEQRLKCDSNPSISIHIRNIVFFLLPFLLVDRSEFLNVKISDERFDVAVQNCLSILHHIQNKLEGDQLSFSERDRIIIKFVISGFTPLKNYPKMEELLFELNRLALTTERKCIFKQRPLQLKWYLENILEINSSYESLFSSLSEKFNQELRRFASEFEATTNSIDVSVNNDDSWISNTVDQFIRFVKDRAGNSRIYTDSIKIVRVPVALKPFVQDAMYLPRSFTREFSTGDFDWVLINEDYLTSPDISVSKANLANILSHEVLPGHSEHLKRSCFSPLSALFNFTRSHIGFEGWAFYSEQIANQFAKDFCLPTAGMNFQRIRRLFESTRQLANVCMGVEGGGEYMSRQISTLPDSVKSRLASIRHTTPIHQLHYGIGLIETETALKSLTRRFSSMSHESIHNIYMQCGPIAPQYIVQMLEQSVL